MGQEISRTFDGQAPARGAPYDVIRHLATSDEGIPDPDYTNGPAPGLGLSHAGDEPVQMPINLNVNQHQEEENANQPQEEATTRKRSRSQDDDVDEDQSGRKKQDVTSETEQAESHEEFQDAPRPVRLYHWDVAPRGDPRDVINAINDQRKRTKRIMKCSLHMHDAPQIPNTSLQHNPRPGHSQHVHMPSYESRPGPSYEMVPNPHSTQEQPAGPDVIFIPSGVVMIPGDNEGSPRAEGFPFQIQRPTFNPHHTYSGNNQHHIYKKK